MGDWDANNCRNLVNNCLNEKFDMSRVMVFNKFYIYRNKCRLATANMMYNNKTNDKKFGEHLFGQNKCLIDVDATTDFMVDTIGQQILLDPMTKEDAMWNFIEFYTRSDVL